MTRFEELCIAIGILGIAVLTISNVIARSLFGMSLAFTEEISQFLIIVVTFLGLGYAVGKGRHIRMTALYDQCSDKTRKFLALMISSTAAGLLFYLAFLGFQYTYGTVHALGSVSPVLQVPLWHIYLAAPVGFVLAGIQ
ncbi:MAG: TRAP transporter small permease [Gammaproteobacteria bacterium]